MEPPHHYKDQLLPAYVFPDDTNFMCSFCTRRIHGFAYSVINGGTTLFHERCSEMPGEITNPFHPHPLIHIFNYRYRALTPPCDLCKTRATFAYSCSNCQFYLDAKCSLLSPLNSTHPQDFINSDSFIPCQRSDHFEYLCTWCGRDIQGMVYADPKSKCLLHESCTNLPDEIHHPFHPSHPLTLVRQEAIGDGNREMLLGSFTCHACGHESGGYCFFCSKCKFYLDVHCAFLEPIHHSPEHEHVTTSHRHPLVPCEPSRNSVTILCSACVQPCNNTAYVCTECHIVLDEFCMRLPLSIRHPFDWLHELVLYQTSKDSFECTVCLKSSKGFRYACLRCDLTIHPGCVWPISFTINSKVHHHTLVFLEEPNGNFHCVDCGKTCITPFFCCLVCKYYLHLHCHPEIPRVVRHKSHLHSLSFTDTPIKDLYDDEDDELYCNACEGRRKLVDPTYYCEECHFVAHVHCFTSQILSHLEKSAENTIEKVDETKGYMVNTIGIENHISDPTVDGQIMLEELVSEIATLSKKIEEQRERIDSLDEQCQTERERAERIACIIGQEVDTENIINQELGV